MDLRELATGHVMAQCFSDKPEEMSWVEAYDHFSNCTNAGDESSLVVWELFEHLEPTSLLEYIDTEIESLEALLEEVHDSH